MLFVFDVSYWFVILVSGLVEYMCNFVVDLCVGFFVVDVGDGDVLNVECVMLLGWFVLFGDDLYVIVCYLCYELDVVCYFVFGDFVFWVFEIEWLCYIGGFG